MSRPTDTDGVSRRGFIGMLGASAATATLTSGCRKGVQHILPYRARPEDLVPGRPVHFATAMNLGDAVHPLLVQSTDGRPTKVEGNPSHPYSPGGGASLWAQAAVYDLYDDDRAKAPMVGEKVVEWPEVEKALAALGKSIEAGKGEGVALLMERVPSPTRYALLKELLARAPRARLFVHDPLWSAAGSEGARLVGGPDAEPVLDLSKAQRILALDADLFGRDGNVVKNARDFADGRRDVDKLQPNSLNRLYVAEPLYTVTGGMADHRLRLGAARVGDLLAAVAARIGVAGAPPAHLEGKAAQWAAAVADDLLAHKGRSLVAVGPRQPAAVHALCHLVNDALGNVGKAVTFVVDPDRPVAGDLAELASGILNGAVGTLLVLGGNPAFTSPADVAFGSLLGQVPTTLYLGYRRNETGRACQWMLPEAHFLEAWGDLRADDGTLTIQQPLIEPLYPSLSAIELLAHLLGREDRTGYGLVHGRWLEASAAPSAAASTAVTTSETEVVAAEKALAAAQAAAKEVQAPVAPPAGTAPVDPAAAAAAARATAAYERALVAFRQGSQRVDAAAKALEAARTRAAEARARRDAEAAKASEGFARTWRQWLHDGVASGTALPAAAARFAPAGLASAWKPLPAQGLELDLYLDACVLDGRFANNPWLQELPDPITKLTWDNAALLSPATAAKIGVTLGDMVVVSHAGRQLRLPALVAKGMADGVVAVPLGYGAKHVGRVARGAGADAYALRQIATPWIGTGATVEKTAGSYPLAVAQDHDSMEDRPLVRRTGIEEYIKDPEFVRKYELEELKYNDRARLWDLPNETGGQQWAMSVDLNVCTGCAACTVACQAENNIPVVGKTEVLNGREMHWIRLDRYYLPSKEDGEYDAVVQPMACLHCETAPCENVCPVAATVHSADGMNDMVYNRCIGTRYCANNCPTKVRRFNFFNFAQRNDDELGSAIAMQRNPNVTVRFRGVMEKCSFCVQRINGARIAAKRTSEGAAQRLKAAKREGKLGAPELATLERAARGEIADGAFVTACQQTCPTGAITFGDRNDPSSQVAERKSSKRNYGILNMINLRPRLTYLARVKNPNPKLVS